MVTKIVQGLVNTPLASHILTFQNPCQVCLPKFQTYDWLGEPVGPYTLLATSNLDVGKWCLNV